MMKCFQTIYKINFVSCKMSCPGGNLGVSLITIFFFVVKMQLFRKLKLVTSPKWWLSEVTTYMNDNFIKVSSLDSRAQVLY